MKNKAAINKDLTTVKVGDVINFVEGKKNRQVSFFTNPGKVIICKHKIPIGYAEILSVEEKDKCFLVTAKHTIKDIYYNITYDDFIKTISLFGYRIGFDREFTGDDGMQEHQIFAYNLKTKVVIVAETFNQNAFNNIEVYLPSISAFNSGLQRLKLADPECLIIFKDCDWLEEII